MIRIRSLITTAALIAGLFCAGCATQPVGTTGFLGSYEGMAVHPQEPTGLRFIAPHDAMLECDQLLFDAFEIHALPNSTLASADPALAKRMAAAFREKLISVVEPYYDVVSKAGPNVMRTRCALSEMKFKGDGRTPDDVVSVRFEAEMLDSVTGKRMAAVVRSFDAGDQSAFDALAIALLDFMNEHHGIE